MPPASPTARPLRCLVIEDQPLDFELLENALRRGGFAPEACRVETESDFVAALASQPEIILSDFALPTFSGTQALALLRERAIDIPFILVSGSVGEEVAVEAMRLGAADYLLKDRIERLAPAVTLALEKTRQRASRLSSQRALAASEARLREAQQLAKMGNWSWDLAADTIEWSAFARRLFGSIDHAPTAGYADFHGAIHPDDRARTDAALRNSADRRTPYDIEYRVVHAGGQEYHVHARGQVEVDAAGRAVRLSGYVQDVTEQKNIEAHLRQAHKMEAIGTLAGGIAHDFNNLLTVINGYTAMARMAVGDQPFVVDQLSAVLKASARAADLVGQILAIGRRQESNRRPMVLREIVTESTKLLRATLPTTIDFAIDLAPDLPPILADATQVQQVIVNLCINAAHAIRDQPGQLEVRAETFAVDERFAARHPGLKAGDYVRLSFTDNGCGMQPATMARIFEPFFTTKSVGEGTGLGLAVVHAIMHAHDGAITVESAPGRGTTFGLYFPAHYADVAPPPTLTPSVNRGSGQRILFVDDEHYLASFGQRLLTDLGFCVESQINPQRALAAFTARPESYDVLVTDYTMPGLTGITLAQKIRLLRPTLPIVLTTGNFASLPAGALQALGRIHLLPKPYTVSSLTTAIHHVLSA